MRNFKRAFCVTLVCVLCAAAVYAAVAEVYFNTEYYYYQDSDMRREEAGDFDFLICGASHGLRAFVPSVLDENLNCNSYNISGSLMTMYGRYFLLKKELERNPVDTVVLEMSYNAMSRDRANEGPEGDLYELGRLDNPAERVFFALRSIRLNEYDKLLYDTFDRGTESLKRMISDGKKYDFHETKGYLAAAEKDQSVSKEYYAERRRKSTCDETVNKENEKYLEKIIELCGEKNIRLIIVVTPLADSRIGRYSNMDVVIGRYFDMTEKYGCEVYDFNLLKDKDAYFPCETAFYDDSHLSDSGARTFSGKFAQIIKDAQNGKDVSEFFYATYDEAEKHFRYN